MRSLRRSKSVWLRSMRTEIVARPTLDAASMSTARLRDLAIIRGRCPSQIPRSPRTKPRTTSSRPRRSRCRRRIRRCTTVRCCCPTDPAGSPSRTTCSPPRSSPMPAPRESRVKPVAARGRGRRTARARRRSSPRLAVALRLLRGVRAAGRAAGGCSDGARRDRLAASAALGASAACAGGIRSVIVPSAISAAKTIVSVSVGCGWIVSAMSSRVGAHLEREHGLGDQLAGVRRRRCRRRAAAACSGSNSSLVKPSSRPSAERAAATRPTGTPPSRTRCPAPCASVSVRPIHATSGSV